MRFERPGSWLVAVGLLTTVGLVASTALAGEQAGKAAAVEALGGELLELDARLQNASGAARAAIEKEMEQVAKARERVLAALARKDPAAALAAATLTGARSTLPRRTRRHVEEMVEEDGVLEVLVEDRHDGSQIHHLLHTATGKMRRLSFAGSAPDLETDDRVRVRGLRVNDVLAVERDGVSASLASAQALTATLSRTLGAQRTLVILVNFRDKVVEPYTTSFARSVVFDTTSRFFLENSFQQTWLEGDVVGWFTIPVDSTTCSSSSIANYAKSAAAAAGVDLSRYARFVYGFPGISACSWWGLGSVGGNPSSAWINGSFAMKVVSHEIGHNFGLYHANAYECGDVVLGSSCSSIEYGDPIDDMGQSGAGHFTAFAKERLGWLGAGNSPQVATVTSSGTYTLGAYETAGADPLALKILKSTDPTSGARTWYYLEYRRPVGFDAFLASNLNVTNGVTVHTGSESTGNSSLLLDMTPGTTSWQDPALAVGQSYLDATSGVTVVPMAAGTSAATVSVSFGAAACVRVAPTVSFVPSLGDLTAPGSSADFVVSITNNDTAACSVETVGVAATVPSGWTSALSVAALSLAPGATGQTTLTVASPAAAASGSYPVSATAVGGGTGAVAGIGGATFRVLGELVASVATDRASYRSGQSVVLSGSVTSGGAPVAGVAVVFRVTQPDGSVKLLSATTGSTGVATATLRVQKKAPRGTYAVLGTATASATLSASAATSFVVQ